MLKEATVNGKKYEVDTTPTSPNGPFRYPFAEIYGVSESPASGVVANVLRQLGKKPVTRVHTIVDDDEEKAIVVQALGWKFSQSKAWKNLWELYGRTKRQHVGSVDN